MSKPRVNHIPEREPVERMGQKVEPYPARSELYLPPMRGRGSSTYTPNPFQMLKLLASGVVVGACVILALIVFMAVQK